MGDYRRPYKFDDPDVICGAKRVSYRRKSIDETSEKESLIIKAKYIIKLIGVSC